MEKKQELESGDCGAAFEDLDLDIRIAVADVVSNVSNSSVLQKQSEIHRVVAGTVPCMAGGICYAAQDHPWKKT